MKLRAFTVTLSLVIIFGISMKVNGQKLNERQLINRTKNVDVSKLDSSLPNQGFGKWLTSIVRAKTKLNWEANDCGEQTGSLSDVDRDIPICVQVMFKLSATRTLTITVYMGSNKKGLLEEPSVSSILLEQDKITSDLKRLSDILDLPDDHDGMDR